MSYNFDDIEEGFDFKLDGNEYYVKYPSTEELLGMPDVPSGEDLPEDERKALRKEAITKQSEYIYQFFTPKDDTTLPIGEVLNKTSVKKLKRFNEVIALEFGL